MITAGAKIERHDVVRCIYGVTVQRQAEGAGMLEWCNEHCTKGYHRGHECPAELRKHNIKIHGQTW